MKGRASKAPAASTQDNVASSRVPWKPEVYGWPELKERWGSALTFPSVVVEIIRHGETTLNEKGRVSGAAPLVSLTLRGEQQARALAHQLSPPYLAAFSSTLKRSKRTLAIALSEAHLKVPKYSDPRLAERALGELEGRRHKVIPEFAAGDLLYAPRGGENYLTVTQRCLSFLADLHRLTKRKRGARVLICTHMGPMRVFKAVADGEADPQQMMQYTFENTQLLRLCLNQVSWPPFLEEVPWQLRYESERGKETPASSSYPKRLLSILRLTRA